MMFNKLTVILVAVLSVLAHGFISSVKLSNSRSALRMSLLESALGEAKKSTKTDTFSQKPQASKPVVSAKPKTTVQAETKTVTYKAAPVVTSDVDVTAGIGLGLIPFVIPLVAVAGLVQGVKKPAKLPPPPPVGGIIGIFLSFNSSNNDLLYNPLTVL